MKLNNKDVDLSKKYIEDISKNKILPQEEEQNLIKIYKDTKNKKARDKIINSNLLFIVKLAIKYNYSGDMLTDLISEGCIGLMKALEEFDQKRNVKFISYAVWWVRAYMNKYIFDHNKLVNIPIENVTYEENGKIKKDYFCLIHKKNIVNIEDQKNLIDDNDTEKETIKNNNNKVVYNCLKDFSKRDRNILTMYFGINKKQRYSYREISKYMNSKNIKMSHQSVKNVKELSLKKIKRDHIKILMELV